MATQDDISDYLKAQNSANQQAMLNIVNLKKFFGPKLDELTSSINSASKSSSFLSKVVILLALVGTLITALEFYTLNSSDIDLTNFSDQQLACVIKHGKEQNLMLTKVAIEYCSRTSKSPNVNPPEKEVDRID